MVEIKDESRRALVFAVLGFPGSFIFSLLALKAVEDTEKLISKYGVGVEFESDIFYARWLAYFGFVAWSCGLVFWLMAHFMR